MLDYPDAAAALALAARLDPALCRVKVGKELFTAAGPAVVGALAARGFDVFLDLKFHDIPNTVAGACRAAAALGAWMVNVHAAGGPAMLRAAREAIDSSAHRPLLIGVTVLTSIDRAALHQTGVPGEVGDQVMRLATLTRDAGLDGVVCSAQEAAMLRAAIPGNAAHPFHLVTTGIRLEGDDAGDQRRVVTPRDAIKMGADFLVIGRSITHAADPVARLHQINEQLQAPATAP